MIRGRSKWLAEIINDRNYVNGVEVGSALGWTTEHILKTCKKLKQYTVADDWRAVSEGNVGPFSVSNMKDQFMDRIGNHPKLKILEGVSWEQAEKVQDGSLDFVFIDASHDYESVIKDLKAWAPKVRPGGMLCGHDAHWDGVKQALKELYPDYDLAGVDNVWYSFIKL